MKQTLVIFGITGDLAQKKLLPALAALRRSGSLPDLRIVGISRRDVAAKDVLDDETVLREFGGITSVVTMNLEDAGGYKMLKDTVNLSDGEDLLMYLSVPPAAAGRIVQLMGRAGLNAPNVKLLLEKPFGIDLQSAGDMARGMGEFYDESQVYRIDHFLAKEMAQNIVVFRAKNALFGHLWNNASIEKIEIDALEDQGIGDRAGFYEQTGALRDVVQNHLMQLLALILMEVSGEPAWDAVPAARLAALRKLKPAEPGNSKRAQYEGYQQEARNPGSRAETFVQLTLFSDAEPWRGVPLILTHGKMLKEKRTEIRITFKKLHDEQSNSLVFRISPREEVEIDLFVKSAGYEKQIEPSRLHFSYPHDTVLPDAYEHVLLDAIRGHKSLFTSSAEVLESWRVVQPLLDAWSFDDRALPLYAQKSTKRTILDLAR